MDFLDSVLGRNGFLPHGYCFTWSPGLLWSMVAADTVIALSYFSIPMALVSFARQRPKATSTPVLWLFSLFIFACGITHVMDVWTIWVPAYDLQAVGKVITAVVSLITAVALWPLLPKALKIPSVDELQAAIASLESEVSRRKTVEEHLLEIEQNLAVTLGSIGAGFVTTDAQGRVTQMNAVAEQVTGWRLAEARGRSIWEVFDREGRPPEMRSRNPLDVIIEQGITVEKALHVVAIARDGTRTTLEVKAAVNRADDGQVRGLAMVFRDMTRLNRAEDDQRRLASIVESSTDAIISKTLDGRITSWNRAAESMFGYAPDEAIGQPVQILIPPDRQAEEMRILADLAHGRVVPPFDTVRRARDGRRLVVSVTISPIRDAAGRVIGGSKIARDVTPQRRAEAAVRQLEAENRQIQESSRLKSQFLANMSHELRTPLNAVIGFADLLHAGAVPVESPKHREFLGHIGASGRHLLQLINDVLDLSKVESGKFEFAPEPVALPRLVDEVCSVLHAALLRKQHVISVSVDPDLTGLSLDPARLKQVLFNYLSNAIKFTPERGHIAVRALPEGPDHFRIEVEDSGIGIADADLPRLFVEFQQLDAGYDKQHPGTGLGLALTRRLVEAQQGHVGVRSTPGQGSVFHLVLPRVPLAIPPTAADTDPLRLLVVEDNVRQADHLATPLSQAGFRVDTASTGAQAVAAASHRLYDGIALDLVMPAESGLVVLADIRGAGPNQASPVVALTVPVGAVGNASFAVADVLFKPMHTTAVTALLARLHIEPGSGTVMVIDDDPMALHLMEATLAGLGFESVCVPDGQQALDEIAVHRPAAVILDLMMPGMDGFGVLDGLRRLPVGASMPVVIWTSMMLTNAEIETLSRSASAIIGKGGGGVAELVDALRRWRLTLPAATQDV